MKKRTNKKRNEAVAGSRLKRYNATKAPATVSTIEPFQSEDQALGYLAEILVEAYMQEKIV